MSEQPGNESVEALDAGCHGRWLVTTRGSTHVWDIGPHRVRYQRLPGERSSRFACDGEQVVLTRVGRWPAVGDTFLLFFDDPDQPLVLEQWRQSSTVQSITRVELAGEGA